MGDEFDRNRRYVDSMTQDEIEKEMKGPESPGVKRPGKIPLSANKQAITEEPATTSSTSQNYKNTPDMNKAHEGKPWSQKPGQTAVGNLIHGWRAKEREEKKKNEPIDKSDEVALKKSISEATTLMKAMKITVERL